MSQFLFTVLRLNRTKCYVMWIMDSVRLTVKCRLKLINWIVKLRSDAIS